MEHTGIGEVSQGNELERLEATIEIKVLTLNSQTYTLRVNKQTSLPELKEQIASVTGVLSEHQRLIYRGRVLRDDQPLSAYQVEDGHTLHLVTREPVPPSSVNLSTQPASGSASNTSRHFQVSSGVVDQDDGVPPIVTQIISALLGAFETNDTERVQAVDLQGVPESLPTLSQYQIRLRRYFDVNEAHRRVSDSASPLHATQDRLPPPELLADLLLSTREMLMNPVADSFLQLGEGLLNQLNLADNRVRQRTQVHTRRTGNAIQHLGSYLLELGRIMTTVRYGRTQSETVVNAGPAIFISQSGPSSLIVQPRFQQDMNFGTMIASATGRTGFSSVNENGGTLIALRANRLRTPRLAFSARPTGRLPGLRRIQHGASDFFANRRGSSESGEPQPTDNQTVLTGMQQNSGDGAVVGNSTNTTIEQESVATASTATNVQETEPRVPGEGNSLSSMLRQLMISFPQTTSSGPDAESLIASESRTTHESTDAGEDNAGTSS